MTEDLNEAVDDSADENLDSDAELAELFGETPLQSKKEKPLAEEPASSLPEKEAGGIEEPEAEEPAGAESNVGASENLIIKKVKEALPYNQPFEQDSFQKNWMNLGESIGRVIMDNDQRIRERDDSLANLNEDLEAQKKKATTFKKEKEKQEAALKAKKEEAVALTAELDRIKNMGFWDRLLKRW